MCACVYLHKKLESGAEGIELPCNYKLTHFVLCRLVGVLGFCGRGRDWAPIVPSAGFAARQLSAE